MARYTLDVNGQTRSLEVHDPQEPLLYVLRNELGLANPHFGCGLAQCGACTVHLDGAAVSRHRLEYSAGESRDQFVPCSLEYRFE